LALAHRVPGLERRDLAEGEVRRKARRATSSRSVAPLVIIAEGLVEERLERLAGAGRPGTPCLAQSLGPVVTGRQEAEIGEIDALDVGWGRREATRRRLWRGRFRQAQAGLRERCEYPVRLAAGVRDPPGLVEQPATETPHLETVRECFVDPFLEFSLERLVAPLEVQGAGGVGVCDFAEYGHGVAATNDEPAADALHVVREARERMVQPPAAGAAGRPGIDRVLVKHEHGDDGGIATRGGGEWGVVGNPQV